ncbi:thiamine pyrophosphate-requiring protein [Marinibacterium profundimaris]|uniref:Acetolactate synthase n=1 Tax=Marinibacterium profundimaris TaxID=1679460 RepID=A0A225NPQ9_9RHOB|nr:thiamine pyrophosphate-requiring protein [Marinibacterium profundimaris]OWU74771.1 acetolactate synthase [Marinibacterium profundimaris]
MDRINAGAALLARLGQLGVKYVFANSGTDFPPLIEAFANPGDVSLPRPVLVPHETACLAMAHGYTLATGQPQAVMVHTNVGLANAVIGALNARADNIPMLIFSGRTPVTEAGHFGSRTVPIGWGQEMADQAALVREACKWDYELRFPGQVHDMVDRAHAIACSVPRGPVYMSLPREVLCAETDLPSDRRPQMRPAIPAARSADIDAAARRIAGARFPVIFAQRGAGSDAAFARLSETVERWAIPVCQYWALQLAIPTDHPMAAGPDPAPLLAQADVILVIDALAPWSPSEISEGGALVLPSPDTVVIQLGQDPLFAQTPVRNFRVDLALPGDTGETVMALCDALDRRDPGDRIAERVRVATANAAGWEARDAEVAADTKAGTLTKRWLSARIARLSRTRPVTVFGELGARLPSMRLSDPQSWFESPHSGGLGFGVPAALGYHMANPERLCVAMTGDGSWIFANPLACLQVARSMGLSILVVVVNNGEWHAVRAAVEGLYPDGAAARSNTMPLTDLSPSTDHAAVATACGALGLRAGTVAEFEALLPEAVAHVTEGRGTVVIDAQVVRV